MAGDDFETIEQCLGLLAAMRFDEADHDVPALFLPSACLKQHLIGLTDAWGGAEENFQVTVAAFLFLHLGQKRIGRRTLLLWLTPLVRHRLVLERSLSRVTRFGSDPRRRSARARSRSVHQECRGSCPLYARR